MRLRQAKQWVARRVSRRVLSAPGSDGLGMLPARAQVPLRRHGWHPVPELSTLRETEPVSSLVTLLGRRVWLVSGYEEVRTVLRDTESYSNDIRPLVGKQDAHGADAIGGLGFTDPPDHTRLRKYLAPEFTRRRLDRLQPRITEIVEDELDRLASATDPADLASGFAFAVPFRVICELLGLSEVDRAEFARLGTARFDASTGIDGVFGAASTSREFLIGAAARQRHDPGDGLLGSLASQHGAELDDVELGGLADGVFLGGYETSASMLSLGALVLLEHPEVYQRLRRDPGSVDAVVEELLRVLSVVQVAFPRFAREDLDLFGRSVAAGDIVACSLSGANRDEGLATQGDRFDPDRQTGGPHLGFGHGMHRCVGAELARMELRTALLGLARRFPDLRLAVPTERLSFRPLSIVYGVESLPVHVHPAEGAASVDPARSAGSGTRVGI